MSDDLLQAFHEGRKAERRATAAWLENMGHTTLSALVRAGAHAAEGGGKQKLSDATIRKMSEAELKRAIERDRANRIAKTNKIGG